MIGIHQFAALLIAARERYDYTGEASPRGLVFGQPRLATFTSERPLTKRQKRRQRGKGLQ